MAEKSRMGFVTCYADRGDGVRVVGIKEENQTSSK